jgi:hypothetical protein
VVGATIGDGTHQRDGHNVPSGNGELATVSRLCAVQRRAQRRLRRADRQIILGVFFAVRHQESGGELVGLIPHGHHHAGLGDAVIRWLVSDDGVAEKSLKPADPARALFLVTAFDE